MYLINFNHDFQVMGTYNLRKEFVGPTDTDPHSVDSDPPLSLVVVDGVREGGRKGGRDVQGRDPKPLHVED